MWYIHKEILSKTRNSVSTGDKSKISAGYFKSRHRCFDLSVYVPVLNKAFIEWS